MPKKKTESETLTETSQDAKSNNDSIESATEKRRRRRTADDILSAVFTSPEPEAPKPKQPSRKPKTLAEELANDSKKPRVARTKKVRSEDPVAAAKSEFEPEVKPVRVRRLRDRSSAKTIQPELIDQVPVEVTSVKTPAQKLDSTTETFSKRASDRTEAIAPEKKVRAPRVRVRKELNLEASQGNEASSQAETESAQIPVTFRSRKKSEPKKKVIQSEEVIDVDGVFTLNWRPKSDVQRVSEIQKAKIEPTDTTPIADDEGRVLISSWRSVGNIAVGESAVETPSPTRRSRTRRKPGDDAAPTAAAAYGESLPEPVFRSKDRSRRRSESQADVEPEPVKEIKPVVVVRPPIVRRPEAAQVAMHKGHPTIIKELKAYAPHVFYADAETKDQRSIVMEELKEATEQGLKIFSFKLNVRVDSEQAHKSVELATQIAQEAVAISPTLQLIPRICFQSPENWSSKFPDAYYKYLNGDDADPSVADDNYWDEAEKSLILVIEELQKTPFAKNIMGVHFDQQEWFLDEEDGYDISPASTQKFRKWLKMRYRNDIVSLRASWYDGSAQFDRINIPDFREGLGGDEFVRTDRRARKWVDYHLFVSDEIVDRINKMCYAAKRASDGDYLVGVSYGYTFEWSHPYSGHLSLGKLLRCNEIDFASGPSSYRDREPGGTAAFPFPVDSFALNGKLYMSEEDFRTPISGREDRNNASNPLMKTPQALESAHWRGVGGALAHEGGVIWMDSNGAGWLNSPGIWERGKEINTLLTKRLSAGSPTPDVALFIDERSLAYLTDPRAFEILVQQTRESLLRSGLNVGFYLLSDLAHRENFPECKLYLFVNAWDIRPEVRSAIKQRLQRDKKTLFWLYTTGLFEAGRDSLERVREVTGIALRPQPFDCKSGTTLLNTRDELSQHLDQNELARGGQLEPSYFAIPEDALVLGEYTETGLPSFVVRKFKDGSPEEHWTSVFLGEPMVAPGLFRALAQQNGAHVWSFDNDLVHANEPFVTVHCNGTGLRTLILPDNWAAFHLDHNEYMPVENGSIKFKAVDGSTHTFLVGKLGDVQAFINSNPDDLLTINEPIQRDENTLHHDNIAFDVAIMKLDEWVEETWSEDHADDLLLKPSMIDSFDEDSTSSELGDDDEDDRTSGRRRKRRRRSPEKRRGDESFGQTGVSVLFRKRN